ncbi:MAG: TolC family protein [Planctomycetes bacterium]|nr:TolC family protein [Planctomycetota bacterium]
MCLYSAAGAQQSASPASERGGRDAGIDRARSAWHVPDPELARARVVRSLEEAKTAGDRGAIAHHERVIDLIDSIRRPDQIELTLEDALHRTLENSYTIEIDRFNPAVETTRIVEAESAFDALFFTNITKNKVDRPTGSQLVSGDLDSFTSSYGIRKLMATGAQISGSYNLSRTKTSLSFQQLNPEYFSQFIFEVRQPFLRGLGIDTNLSGIRVAKNNRRISDLAFRQQIRDVLRQVEEAYWRLVEARRNVVITARLLADFEKIFQELYARRDFDITPVQLNATTARLERSKADFVRVRAALRNAEDRLIALMNTPDVNLTDAIEIIPTDLPDLSSVKVDRIAEVQSALEHRPELQELKLRIENSRINVNVSKNAELPRLDVSFRTSVDGLAGTADRSFDEVSRRRYIEYFVGIEFEMPIGNRGPRAVATRAMLQHRQAEAALKARFEEVILDVNTSVRAVESAHDQLAPRFASVEARGQEVDSIVARAERKDINTLNSELAAREGLAADRRTMLNAMVEYNIAIIDLERAKGTLLQYYNVHISDEFEE